MASATSNKYTNPKIWDNAASSYEDAVARSSKTGARRLITLANDMHPLSTPNARAIDLGAGTGAVTHLLAAAFPALPILATDISPGMLDQLMSLRDDGSNVTSQIADMANPVGGAATGGSFSHVFSTMAIQALPEPAKEGTLHQWSRLLAEGGIVAIGMWDFDEHCGPLQVWAEAAKAADPSYVSPPILLERHWMGRRQLEEGLKEAGYRDVRSEVCELGFDVGKEGFMRFFWESENPMVLDKRSSFGGDLRKVKMEMERVLDENYDGGRKIPLFAALAVGRKPVAS